MSEEEKKIEPQPTALAEEQTICEEAPTIENLQQEVAELKDQLLRALAEAENVRRRALKDREETQKFGITQFARDILAVADNLRRALENVPSEIPEGLKNLVSGIEMTERELESVFDKAKLKKNSPLHEKFDPAFHQAMFEIPTLEHAPGVVVQVLQAGYTLHDRLLRPAMVGVAKAPNAPEANTESSTDFASSADEIHRV